MDPFEPTHPTLFDFQTDFIVPSDPMDALQCDSCQ